MVQTLNFNADAWCLERFDPEFEIHSNKHASCDRRYVIMVDVIIRIMKSYDLFDSNSNHECLNLNESQHVLYFLNYMRCTWSVWINLNVGPSVRMFDTWKFFISNSTSSTQMHHTTQIILYGSAHSDYWNLNFRQHTHVLQVGSFYREIFEIIGVCWCSDFNCRTILTLTCSQDVVSWEHRSAVLTLRPSRV
jgi:hypothetical protein